MATSEALPLCFEAALAGSGRKCLTIDSDGEVTLTLVVPASAAPVLVLAMAEGRLQDRAFLVTLDLEAKP